MRRKQRTFTPDFKVRVVLEYLTGQKRRVEILREHQLNDGTLDRWIKRFSERAPQAFAGDDQSELAGRDRRIAELERMIGRLTMELEATKKVSIWLGSRDGRSGR